MLRLADVRYAWPGSPGYAFSLTVAPGEIVALVGQSGAGKSTLLDLVAGFLKPVSGDITWNGGSLLGLAPADRPVAALFQSGNLFEHLNATANVALGIDPGGRLDAAGRARVEAALAAMGLGGLGDRLPGALSGGQQQRVALARALIRDRPVLLLDEPFGALDLETRRDVLALVRRLVDERRLAALLVSHDAADLAAVGARAVALRDGRCAG